MTKADVMVVPLQASAFDLWPLDKLKQLYDLADSVGAAPAKVLLVISRAPTNPSITDPEEAAAVIAEDERYSMFTLVNTHIRERICFRRSISQGLSVFELVPQDDKAIFEVRQLYKEIYK
jgi:chromosome partitioning protein